MCQILCIHPYTFVLLGRWSITVWKAEYAHAALPCRSSAMPHSITLSQNEMPPHRVPFWFQLFRFLIERSCFKVGVRVQGVWLLCGCPGPPLTSSHLVSVLQKAFLVQVGVDLVQSKMGILLYLDGNDIFFYLKK